MIRYSVLKEDYMASVDGSGYATITFNDKTLFLKDLKNAVRLALDTNVLHAYHLMRFTYEVDTLSKLTHISRQDAEIIRQYVPSITDIFKLYKWEDLTNNQATPEIVKDIWIGMNEVHDG